MTGDSALVSKLVSSEIPTPAYVYSTVDLENACKLARIIAEHSGSRLLYSMKACSVRGTLELISEHVEGFACSSVFEAIYANDIFRDRGTVHLTAPGLRPNDIGTIGEVCDFLSFNSLSQWEIFKDELGTKVSCGLRINPKLSLVQDSRYDPCAKHSKLGIPFTNLVEIVENSPGRLKEIRGVHLHTNCDSSDFAELNTTVRHLEAHLAPLLDQVEWINLGGGYLFNSARNIDAFYDASELLKKKYRLELYIEPGASIVRNSGFLVSTVLDLFVSDGKSVAILDTTVNHLPEVFEYQFEPDVVGHVDDGKFNYILTGCTCLAGDQFGEYAFNDPLEIGSRVIFPNAGAYTLVKANMFNGVNLPSIYAMNKAGELKLEKKFTYDDFADRWSEAKYACP